MISGKLRLRFSKTGRAKYISHLDLMATMRRALLRAGLNLEYSKGFNPHPYMSVALPLPVGNGSICELMDVGITIDTLPDGLPGKINEVLPDGLPGKINEVLPDGLTGKINEVLPEDLPGLINNLLPEGLKVSEVYIPERKFNSIAWVGISGLLCYDAGAPPDAAERLTERFTEESIVISKKTKRGVSEINISPFVRDISFQQLCEVTMSARISAQNPSINTENLLSALKGGHESLIPDFYDFTRTEVFDTEMNVFR